MCRESAQLLSYKHRLLITQSSRPVSSMPSATYHQKLTRPSCAYTRKRMGSTKRNKIGAIPIEHRASSKKRVCSWDQGAAEHTEQDATTDEGQQQSQEVHVPPPRPSASLVPAEPVNGPQPTMEELATENR